MNTRLCLIALPAVFTCLAALSSDVRPVRDAIESASFYHPHYAKVLECRLPNGPTLTIRYQTATFDAEGAKNMKPGQSWHLAGATIETTWDVVIGGEKIAAGKYALSVRKTTGKKWELTLHKGRGFSQPGKSAHALKTSFKNDSLLFEHLNIDVQPAGDKKNTTVHLDVRFDTLLATATIVVPKKKK